MLKGKHIILGVTGSIAAYKAATLTRLLVKEGASVKVVMTPLGERVYYSLDNGDSFQESDYGRFL